MALSSPQAVASQERGCSPTPGDTASLGTSLPLPVLDHLEGIASSPFAHAFLLAHLKSSGNSRHRLVLCARSYIETGLGQLDSLRSFEIPAHTLIEALRLAENRRLADVETVARNDSLPSVVERTLEELTEARLLSFVGQVDRCSRGRICEALGYALERVEEYREAGARLRTSQDSAEVLRAAMERVSDQLEAAREVLQRDSLGPAPDTTGRVAELETRLEVLANERSGVEAQVQALGAAVTQRLEEVRNQLANLRSALARAAAADIPALKVPEPVRGGGEISTAPPQLLPDVTPASTARPADPINGLTAVIVERARKEVIFGFIAFVYDRMKNEPALQTTFDHTFKLMDGIAAGSRLSIPTAGRVPLDVWRAALVQDFRVLPLRIVRAAAACDEEEAGDGLCSADLRQLMPLVIIGERFFKGDPLLSVLTQAPLFAATAGSAGQDRWKSVVYGLGVVAGVARAYDVQGLYVRPNPRQHPYVLNGASFLGVSLDQRKAFARVLLTASVPDSIPGSLPIVDSQANEILRRLALALDRIVALQSVGPTEVEVGEAAAARALEVVAAGVDFAKTFRPDGVGELEAIRVQWLQLADIVSPLLGGRYSLAMARIPALLRPLNSSPIVGQLLTLSALASGLAEAETANDVRAAFEAAAAPVGGWQAKRYREAERLSISAFPGVVGGWEWVAGTVSDGATLAATLPLGLEVQLLGRSDAADGESGCFARVCSVGLTFSFVDLGALLSFRLDNPEGVESQPNATLRQIFAPGAFVTLGLGRTPFALMWGGQFMPELRSLEGSESGSGGEDAWRLVGGIGVDVTLLSF